jgi:cyclopropane fatty-acyl-phospholipid synthase-like methyltransferase
LTEQRIGIDYSELHRLDSPANRLIRESIWTAEEDIGQTSFITPRYLDDLIRRLDIRPGTHLLDVGSGTGGPAIDIAAKTGCRVAGIEVNDVGVEVSRRLVRSAGLEGRVEFLQADAMVMPFEGATFDLAISLNVVNVFEDKVGLFKQVHRVLKPSAIWAFLSGTFDLGDDDDEIRQKLARGYLIPQYYDSLRGYKEKLSAAGFRIEEVTEYIADFWVQVKKWGDAYREHEDEIAKEQGAENTAYHIEYFETYLALIEAGKASNHLVIATRPGSESGGLI